VFGRPTNRDRVAAVVDLCAVRDSPPWTAAYVDATSTTPAFASSGTTALHVLWTASETLHVIHAGADPWEADRLGHFEVHPGDTMTLPPRTPFAVGEGIVAFVISTGALAAADAPGNGVRADALRPPAHGLQVFRRFNRRTFCTASPAMVLERWKITQPLSMELDRARWHYLTNLVAPVALTWPGGTDLLGRTASRVLPQGMTTINLVPDGLGYVLLAYVPDLERDVVSPLRSAGYDRATISALIEGPPIDAG
jgi:hypothetical protein